MSASSYRSQWWSLAACRSADPELFFPISRAGPSLEQTARAKAVCGGCKVRQECLEFALDTRQSHGIWGQTSAEERTLLSGGDAGSAVTVGPSGSPPARGRMSA